MAVQFKTREQWGDSGREVTQTEPDTREAFMVHYDGGDPVTHLGDDIPKRVLRTHLANEWNGVGYNFIVDQAGNVYEGRGWDGVGAHCTGWNVKAIGVQVAVGGDQVPSKAALTKVRELYDEACERTGKELAKMGHRDGKATECPGTKLTEFVEKGFPATMGAAPKPLLPAVGKKTIATLVAEVLAGQHGSGDQRKKSLGKQYEAVQAEINKKLGVTPAPAPAPSRVQPRAESRAAKIKRLAAEVIAGKHGSGTTRQRRLGDLYDEVQAEVNSHYGQSYNAPAPDNGPEIRRLAQQVIDGKLGTGDERKRRLGNLYEEVQAEVNRRLS